MATGLPILQVGVRHAPDILRVQQRARMVAALAGLATTEQTRLAAAASEIAQNALQYAGGGVVEFSVIEREGQQYLQVTVHDKGPGVPHLKRVLWSAYQSRTEVNQDRHSTQKSVDFFEIQTDTVRGTVVAVAKGLEAKTGRVENRTVVEWSKTLANEAVASPFDDLQGQNSQLIEVLQELDEYLEQVEETQQTRTSQAYMQGRLDVLDTVVHNVGNALHAVTAGLGAIESDIKHNQLIRYFADFVEVIKNHQDDFAEYIQNDPKGQQAIPFLIALAESVKKREKKMLDRVRHVSETVDHIADILRSQKALGPKNVYRKPINVRHAIEHDVLLILSGSIDKRKIHVDLDCHDAPDTIYTLESPFQQMLINLVKNAIEAIDERRKSGIVLEEPPTIRISAQRENGLLHLSIADNGIGIEKDKLGLIFHPRYTTKSDGTGLGLHSVANFVKESGGRVWAESGGRGDGATIHVMLPINDSTESNLSGEL